MRLVRGQRRAHQPPAEHSRRDGSPSVRRHRANFRDHEAARHRCLAQVSRNECPNRTPRRRRSIHAFASFADLRVFGAGGTSTSEHPTLWVLFRHSASEPGDVGRGPARVLQSSHARRPSGRLDASAEMTLNYGTGASEKKITPRLHMVNPPGHPRHALLGGSGRVAKKTIISARAQSRACATLNLGGLQGGGMCARPVDRVIVFFRSHRRGIAHHVRSAHGRAGAERARKWPLEAVSCALRTRNAGGLQGGVMCARRIDRRVG